MFEAAFGKSQEQFYADGGLATHTIPVAKPSWDASGDDSTVPLRKWRSMWMHGQVGEMVSPNGTPQKLRSSGPTGRLLHVPVSAARLYYGTGSK